MTHTSTATPQSVKPWFSKECKAAKQRVKVAYKVLRKAGYPSTLRVAFVKIRKGYRQLVKEAKQLYIDSIKADLREVKQTSKFWKT
ncbi:unnamed protein product, partial [Allacma fusca]